MERDLLQDLAIAAGCAYISDLTQLSYREQIPMVLESIDWNNYTVEQWNDAVNYISRSTRIFDNAEGAYRYLLNSLAESEDGYLF